MSEQQTPSYNPNKKYTWTPDDSFTLSGGEFGLILNALRAVLNTEEAARILIANEANKIVEGALQRAVESGVAKEASEE
jgi:roadblock/LC7 domain-containing protein